MNLHYIKGNIKKCSLLILLILSLMDLRNAIIYNVCIRNTSLCDGFVLNGNIEGLFRTKMLKGPFEIKNFKRDN